MSASFGDLHGYITDRGIVVPQTSSIKKNVENAFVEIFGSNISLNETTIVGRLVEAITMLFVDVVGINAQNANGLNPNVAPGAFLDSIGTMLGISRLDGESDDSFRTKIANFGSRGTGYARSIGNEISKVSGVLSVCVLENGSGYNKVIGGISLAPHSIFVSVSGGDEDDISNAIYSTKSAGCAFTNSPIYGEVIHKEILREDGSKKSDIFFYRPSPINVSAKIKISSVSMSPEESESETKSIVVDLISKKERPSEIRTEDVVSAIATRSQGRIICTRCELFVDGVRSDSFSISPTVAPVISNDSVEVV